MSGRWFGTSALDTPPPTGHHARQLLMLVYLPILLLAGALVLFYLAARDIERAFGPTGLLAPLAAIVLVSAAMGCADVALGSALSGAVASLGLAGGLSLMQRPSVTPTSNTPTSWALLVPAALAVFMIGMSGFVTWAPMGALAVLGIAICPVLLPHRAPNAAPVNFLLIALSFALAALAGWAAVHGVTLLSETPRHPPAALLAATVLGPAAVMPLLSYATTKAREGDGYAALGSCVAFSAGAALFLPALAGATYWLRTKTFAPFPITLWRVECILFLVLAVLMVPLAAKRFTPTRRDGGILLGLYVLYLLISTVSGLRLN